MESQNLRKVWLGENLPDHQSSKAETVSTSPGCWIEHLEHLQGSFKYLFMPGEIRKSCVSSGNSQGALGMEGTRFSLLGSVH